MALIQKKAQALGHEASAPEQTKRALVAINPLQKLSASERIFGGYYAPQCDATDSEKQTTYRTTSVATELGRLESRYAQTRVGECGEKTDGVYPLVLRGSPTKNPPRPDLDLRGVDIERCIDHKKQVFRFGGDMVKAARPFGDASDPVMPMVASGGC